MNTGQLVHAGFQSFMSSPFTLVAFALALLSCVLIGTANTRLRWPTHRMWALAIGLSVVWFLGMQAVQTYSSPTVLPTPVNPPRPMFIPWEAPTADQLQLLSDEGGGDPPPDIEYCGGTCDPGVILYGRCCWPSRSFCLGTYFCG